MIVFHGIAAAARVQFPFHVVTFLIYFHDFGFANVVTLLGFIGGGVVFLHKMRRGAEDFVEILSSISKKLRIGERPEIDTWRNNRS